MDSEKKYFAFTKVPEDIVVATAGRINVGTRFFIISETRMRGLSYPNLIKHCQTDDGLDDGLTLYIKPWHDKVGFSVHMNDRTLFDGELASGAIAWEPVAPVNSMGLDGKQFEFTKVPDDVVTATAGRIGVGTRFVYTGERNSYGHHIVYGSIADDLLLEIKPSFKKVGFVVRMGLSVQFDRKLALDAIAWEPVAPVNRMGIDKNHFKFTKVSDGVVEATAGRIKIGTRFEINHRGLNGEIQGRTSTGLDLEIKPWFDNTGFISVSGDQFEDELIAWVAWEPAVAQAVAPMSGGAVVAPMSGGAGVAPMSSIQPGLEGLIFTKVPFEVSKYIRLGEILLIRHEFRTRGLTYPNHVIRGRTMDNNYEVHLKPYEPFKVGIEIWNAAGDEQLYNGEFEPGDAIQWEKRRIEKGDMLKRMRLAISSDDDGGGPGRFSAVTQLRPGHRTWNYV